MEVIFRESGRLKHFASEIFIGLHNVHKLFGKKEKYKKSVGVHSLNGNI